MFTEAKARGTLPPLKVDMNSQRRANNPFPEGTASCAIPSGAYSVCRMMPSSAYRLTAGLYNVCSAPENPAKKAIKDALSFVLGS